MSENLISLEQVDAGYGAAQVLFQLSFSVAAGEVVTLMGRNGMGKTTTIRTLFGLLRVRAGRIFVQGRDMTRAPSHRRARAGLGYVPEGRLIFPRLSVQENLIATANQSGNWTLDRVYRLFPRLAERRAHLGNQISGGEQQMLAIGRALMTNPRLLVLDEATEGLAPVICHEIWSSIAALRADGLAILIVDKNLDALAKIADRHIVIEKGQVVWSGSASELERDRSLATRHLEI